jgi:hypothetical protein
MQLLCALFLACTGLQSIIALQQPSYANPTCNPVEASVGPSLDIKVLDECHEFLK